MSDDGEDPAERDARARERDAEAERRDRAAAERDRAAEALLASLLPPGPGVGARLAAALGRYRRQVAADRAFAAGLRAHSAQDRVAAARDRARAAAEAVELRRRAGEREPDPLTGVRARAGGLAELEREMARARRSQEPLTVAYVDIAAVGAHEGQDGQERHETLVRRVVGTMRGYLRQFDLVVRMGDDEFLCVLSGMETAEARRRFDAINTALADEDAAIVVGYAALGATDTPTRLVERADGNITTATRRRGARHEHYQRFW